MAYMKANLGSSGGGGAFPKPGHAIVCYGQMVRSRAEYDLNNNASFSVTVGAASIYGDNCFTFVVNLENTNFTKMTVSSAGGAYCGLWGYDEEGEVITTFGSPTGNIPISGAKDIPGNCKYLHYTLCNYNYSYQYTASVSFS